jgi:hypothetical protein
MVTVRIIRVYLACDSVAIRIGVKRVKFSMEISHKLIYHLWNIYIYVNNYVHVYSAK